MIESVELVQALQAICFTVVFFFIWRQSRTRTLRLICIAFLVASFHSAVALSSFSRLPVWLLHGVAFEIFPASYGLLTLAVIEFLNRSRGVRIASPILLLASLPLFLLGSSEPGLLHNLALFALCLGTQTFLLAIVLLRSRDEATRNARLALAGMLAAFAAIQFLRVGITLRTGMLPNDVLPGIDLVTLTAYVVCGAVIPAKLIWMINARTQAHLILQTQIDPLTELLNRRGLYDAAQREIARYLRRGQDFAVAIADIDHFKRLNDTHGHACGDQVLRNLATFFRKTLRASDVVSRSGGEEFIFLLPLTSGNEGFSILERMRLQLGRLTFQWGNATLPVAVSIGITSTRGRMNVSWESLQQEADLALYTAKRNGRNQTVDFLDAQAQQPPPRPARRWTETVARPLMPPTYTSRNEYPN